MSRGIRLGVNVDHIATLRQVRGGTTEYPDLAHLARVAVKAGAEQITIHLREDRRHIQVHDLVTLAARRPALLNLEMAATDEMARFARKHRPDWCCIVPEKRRELTTEGGLDVDRGKKRMMPMIERLQRIGIEISMFIEPSLEQVRASYESGADAVEFHTGRWVHLKGPAKEREWARLQEAAFLAHALGLGVHAGHGLDYAHTAKIARLHQLREVNIGHSLICYAIEEGLAQSVKKMKKILRSASR